MTISVFLLEELGDARLRCAQLRKYVEEGMELINKSKHRDHFFEVAAHLIYGVPDTLLRLEKALMAAALAASKLDYEEIKDTLRPEKVDELEEVFEDIRLRRVRKQSEEGMKIPEAVERLEHLAQETEATGHLEARDVYALIYDLEGPSETKREEVAKTLRKLASEISTSGQERPSRLRLASKLRRVLAETMSAEPVDKTAAFKPLRIKSRQYGAGIIVSEFYEALKQDAENTATWSESHRDMSTLIEEALSGHTRDMGPLAFMPDSLIREVKNLNSFESSVANQMHSLSVKMDRLADRVEDAALSREAEDIEFGRHDLLEPLERRADEKEGEKEIESRFEEGKPADPTKNMSPEDAKKWKEEHEKNKDKFKDKEARSYYRGDPRWIHARYPGQADDGTPFKRGDLVLYWPRTKTFMVGKKAEDAWRRFEMEVEDEDIYMSTYGR